jgi:hypothetical protein
MYSRLVCDGVCINGGCGMRGMYSSRAYDGICVVIFILGGSM